MLRPLDSTGLRQITCSSFGAWRATALRRSPGVS
jgi:hypothetical protein